MQRIRPIGVISNKNTYPNKISNQSRIAYIVLGRPQSAICSMLQLPLYLCKTYPPLAYTNKPLKRIQYLLLYYDTYFQTLAGQFACISAYNFRPIGARSCINCLSIYILVMMFNTCIPAYTQLTHRSCLPKQAATYMYQLYTLV